MWCAATLTIALAALWFSTGWWWAAYGYRTRRIRFETAVHAGLFRLGWTDSRDVPPRLAEQPSAGWQDFHLNWWQWWWYGNPFTSIAAGRLKGDLFVIFPLWVFPLGMTIPTLIAWRLDARARRLIHVGNCPSCGYSRAGLVTSKPCPECGITSVHNNNP